jgi:hypothetical protein
MSSPPWPRKPRSPGCTQASTTEATTRSGSDSAVVSGRLPLRRTTCQRLSGWPRCDFVDLVGPNWRAPLPNRDYPTAPRGTYVRYAPRPDALMCFTRRRAMPRHVAGGRLTEPAASCRLDPRQTSCPAVGGVACSNRDRALCCLSTWDCICDLPRTSMATVDRRVRHRRRPRLNRRCFVPSRLLRDSSRSSLPWLIFWSGCQLQTCQRKINKQVVGTEHAGDGA